MTFFLCCKNKSQSNISVPEEVIPEEISLVDSAGNTIVSRFAPPQGFRRSVVDTISFAYYLRNFRLLHPKEKVYLFNGGLKSTQSVHASILDIDVGDRDLQQCADAVMRLRAEYLFAQKKYDEIGFDFTNGWKFEYSKWRQGFDLVVNGNRTKWKSGAGPKESYKDFREYLDWVFMYAGTLSLARELKPKKLEDIEIGDVFIYGGSPGHAVIVVDLAINETTGDKAFMIAQSYMPAQQIHILKNEFNDEISPWYLVSQIDMALNTPEWVFERNALKEF